MQGTAHGVRKLCHEFGVDAESSDMPASDQNRDQNGPPRTVLGDVQQLVFELRKRDADSHDLKQSIDALVCLIRRNAEDRSGFSTYHPHSLRTTRSSAWRSAGNCHGVVEPTKSRSGRIAEGLDNWYANILVLSHRFDSSSELSSEIRGERLRFVEAMKEATAINVQSDCHRPTVSDVSRSLIRLLAVHVEQFKNELNREVMVMTREIERLHREKQAVENQIADLFAFYSKHKHPVGVFNIPSRTVANVFQARGAPPVHQQSQAPARHPQARALHQHMPGYHVAS
jgi:hypothetical protein